MRGFFSGGLIYGGEGLLSGFYGILFFLEI